MESLVLPSSSERGQPRTQYERTYVLAHPSARKPFMLRLLTLVWRIGERWTVGGSADDAGIGDLDTRRVIALRPEEWSQSGDATQLEGFFEEFYPGVIYWPLDWGNDCQLEGQLLAYSLKVAGLELAYPTTHPQPRITDVFGRWRQWSKLYHCGLDLASSWAVWGDEVLSATGGVVVEAGWHNNQGSFGYRVRVKTVVPDGREVLVCYAHLTGDDGIYVRVGDSVAAGQKLGRPGSTGASTGDHLHIDVKVDGRYADPALLIRWPGAKALVDDHREGSDPPVPFNYFWNMGRVRRPLEREAPPELPPEPEEQPAVLLPCIEDAVECVDWRVAAAIGSAEQMWMIEHSNGGADFEPSDVEVVVVNPREWDGDARAWYEGRFPDARVIESSSPWEMAVKLMPMLEEDGAPALALAQADPRWAGYDFGEQPDDPTGRETIGRYGCFLTGLAIILRRVYGRAVTPPLLDKLLVAARAAYVNDNILMWQSVVPLFPALGEHIKDDEQRSARQLRELLDDGWEIILRRADGGHFVYLEDVEGDTLHIIDTWDGKRKKRPAADYAGIRAARPRERGLTAESDGPSEGASCGRVRVLLPRIEGAVELLEWRIAAAVGSAEQMGVVGHPADGAAGGRARGGETVVVNPQERGGGANSVRVVETETPWEMAVKLMPALDEDVALAQTDPRWAGYDFGEQPDDPAGGETIGGYGCFLTGLAIILRQVYGRAVTPPLLDKLLVAARAAYVDDNILMWQDAVSLFPAFDDSVKDDRRRSARELERLLRGGWEVILRQADGSHFVYLEDVEGDVLHIIDTWDGKRKKRSADDYAGVRAAHVKSRGAARPQHKLLVGLHDERGGEWMADHGIEGCCLVHYVVQRQPVQVDCRHLRDAGITVICRLNWGYADGTGTLPRPEDRDSFVEAMAQTVLTARGVDYFHVGNEPNNRSEWPGFGSRSEFALTPDYVTALYNAVWCRVDGRAQIGPPPVDPYFGPGSNNRDWWTYILDHIAGADALFLHAKTQTNDPAEVWSKARFTDPPLIWQYLHLRTVETALAMVPDRFRALPVFVTELNPQYPKKIGDVTGWLPDNGAWVREALRYFRQEQPVDGVVFYRYEAAGDQAPFGLENNPVILDAIKGEAIL